MKYRIGIRNIKRDKRPDLFSPTPTVLPFRVLLALALWEKLEIGIGDYKQAFLHAAFWIKPPAILKRKGGTLRYSTKAWHGLRAAPLAFSCFLADQLIQVWFFRCRSDPIVFKISQRQLTTSIHVDDPLATAPSKEIDWYWTEMKKRIKFKRGPSEPTRYLGKTYVRVDASTLLIQQDPQYVLDVSRELDMEKRKPAPDPMELTKGDQGETELLGPEGKHRFLLVSGSVRHMLTERTDVLCAMKELSHAMSAPMQESWQKLKRLV